jgi:hypothetical protein
VYLALFQSSIPHQQWIPLNRSLVMRLARLKGRNTYHKILRDLSQMGYITYQPSKYYRIKSRAKLARSP